MKISKFRKTPNVDSADGSRRSFFWKLGAGASAALASTAGIAAQKSDDAADLSLQLALLEEEKVLRDLHQSFEQALDDGRYEDVVELFADDAAVVFNGGVFKRRRQGIDRLFTKRFRSGQAGKRIEQAPGFELDAGQQQEGIEVAADLQSATAEFPYSIQVGVPVASESSHADMARLQGGGVRTWWEGGLYRLAYTKDADGNWKIGRLEYDTKSRADYRSGRTEARPITVAPLATRYPENQLGPDVLV